MAIAALTMSAVKTIESVLDPAKGTPDATKFTIGAIDTFVWTYVHDRTLVFGENEETGKQTAQVKLNEVNLELVRFGLKDWANFKDEKGNDVEFKTVERFVMGKKYQVVADDCLLRFDVMLVREIANAIRDINEVKEIDAGKSEAA